MPSRPLRDRNNVPTSPAPLPSAVQYREFDLDHISDMILRAASVTLDAVAKYERAKDVPQQVLDAEVCI